MDEITNILDARLPQPWEWDRLPRPLRTQLDELSRRRSSCPDDEVDAIDREMIRLLLPHRKKRKEI